MPTTYILGHLKPDTDAVVAAMGLEYLYKNCDCYGYENPQAVVTGSLNPETTFLFDKFSVSHPKQITASDLVEGDKVVLVDHNEAFQRLENLNEDFISEIVDHHKVNLNLNQPIFMTFKTWGSSSTIVYYLMKENSVTPDKTMASLLLAAVLSDTVGFKSATTTPKDKELGMELAKLAQIDDVETFTLEIFKAKSNVSTLSPEEIVKNDFKIFEFGKKTFMGQLETVEQDEIFSSKKTDLLKAMQSVKAAEGVELLFLAITDILKVNTKLLILGKAEQVIAEAAFGGSTTNNVLDIGPKMSRKKEIAPPIEKALT
jgi:manganese-dependent inorganic pyrophosphatase